MSARGLLLSLASAWIAMPVFATQSYFVSTSGNDSWPGTAAQPWLTLQHAANNVTKGDHVTVRPGSYAGFNLTADGDAGSPITFLAEPGVHINAPNPVRPDHGINLEDASYVVIDGFTVSGMDRAGVRTVGVNGNDFASHVTIRNVRSHDNGYWGILTGFVHDLLIENNETWGSTIEHGIYVSNSGDRPVIRDNISWGNNRNGIHINGDEDVGGDGIITGALVSGNVIYDNGRNGGSGINMDGIQHSRIENNLIFNNHASGISLYRIDGGGPSTGNVVVNNTIHQADDARWALNIQNASTGNTALNNVLISESTSRGAIDISQDSLPGFTSDHNVVISRFTTNGGNSNINLTQWRAATGQDMNSIVATAGQLFANPAAGNYQLLATSEAINAGTSLHAPPGDLEGRPRPIGAAYDVGALEFGAHRGDFNRDGTVNAADYALWRNTLGQQVARYSGADADGSGRIDVADFAAWRANFGAGAPASGAAGSVPEPSSTGVTLLGLLVSLLLARRVSATAVTRLPAQSIAEPMLLQDPAARRRGSPASIAGAGPRPFRSR